MNAVKRNCVTKPDAVGAAGDGGNGQVGLTRIQNRTYTIAAVVGYLLGVLVPVKGYRIRLVPGQALTKRLGAAGYKQQQQE